MSELLTSFREFPGKVTPIAILDIVVVAALIYYIVVNIRGRRGAQILFGMLTLLIVYNSSQYLGLELLGAVMAMLAPYTVVALIVLFQSELRRMLMRIVPQRLLGFRARLERVESADEILLSLQYMAQHRTGALIVVEREIGLRTFIETGVFLDARLSRDLLISLFYPDSPLHDGAVIVQGDRVAAAACFLPLTLNPTILNSVGSRHRAAIGITEDTDCLALIVSEETGNLSYAIGGAIHSDVEIGEIEAQLTDRKLRQSPAVPATRVEEVGSQKETPEVSKEAVGN